MLDAGSGAVRAMVGGRDWHTGLFNRAVAARRQPGSSFKVFVWLAALEKGATPDDTVSDAPIRLGGYSPSNFEPGFRGDVTLEEALAQSLNTASVRLLVQAGGPRAVAAVAHGLGIADTLPDNASLALGTGEVGVLEMAAAYASLFNGGYAVVPTALEAAESGSHPGRPAAPGADPGRARGAGGDDGADAGRGGQPRQRPGRRGAWTGGGRQDGNDAGLPRRLVHRRRRPGCHRRLARQ